MCDSHAKGFIEVRYEIDLFQHGYIMCSDIPLWISSCVARQQPIHRADGVFVISVCDHHENPHYNEKLLTAVGSLFEKHTEPRDGVTGEQNDTWVVVW